MKALIGKAALGKMLAGGACMCIGAAAHYAIVRNPPIPAPKPDTLTLDIPVKPKVKKPEPVSAIPECLPTVDATKAALYIPPNWIIPPPTKDHGGGGGTTSAPEPSSAMLLGGGLIWYKLRKKA